MVIIRGPRRSGKTTRLIKMSSDLNARIVCANNSHKDAIRSTAEHLGIDIKDPMTINDMINGRVRGEANHGLGEKILIDELYYVLKEILKKDILAITTSDDLTII